MVTGTPFGGGWIATMDLWLCRQQNGTMHLRRPSFISAWWPDWPKGNYRIPRIKPPGAILCDPERHFSRW